MDQKNLEKKTVAELKKLAQELKLTGISSKTKPQLIEMIISKAPKAEQTESNELEKPTEATKPEIKQVAKVKAETKSEAKTDETKPQTNLETKVEEKPALVQSQVVANGNPTNSTTQPTVPQTGNQPQVNQQVTRNPQHNNIQNNNQNRQNNFQNRNSQQNQNRNNHQNNQGNQNQQQNYTNDATVDVTGILEIMSDGTHGVLRTQKLIPTDKDTYISISQVKKLKLRKGDVIEGTARLPKENERYYSLLWIKTVNGTPIDQLKDRVNFDDLKPVYPDKQLKLECGQYPISNRVIDMLAPIGFGQRAMIVAPPKAGKTTLLKDIAKGINENHPNVTLMVVLIGERPEEVTDIERSVKGIVYASNFDDSPANQVAVAELSLERAKRMVEAGQDVIILMDSLTRLARAYNVALPASGRTLSGGLDPVSLYPSKRFFGAARNFENGASLTIVATSLVDTGSKMDDVIFEEFKGTGNMELKLDRRMANKRVFPAINLLESGTRNEELLLGSENLHNSWKIRRMLESLGDEGNEALIDRMKSSKSNEEFLNTLHQY